MELASGSRSLRSHRTAQLLGGTILSGGLVLLAPAASAQTWGGPGSTTTTLDYNLDTNWGPPNVPDADAETATFANTGLANIELTAPVAPSAGQFSGAAQDYVILGSTVTFGGAGLISSNTAGTVAINNNLAGAGAVVFQQAPGTLILRGVNSYSGGTGMAGGGTISVAADTNLGAAKGTLNFANGTLVTTGTFATTRAVVVNPGSATFAPSGGTTLTLNGEVSGPGPLTHNGSGTLVFGARNTNTGPTIVRDGTLAAGAENVFSPTSAVTVDGGTLTLADFPQTIDSVTLINGGVLGGGGSPTGRQARLRPDGAPSG
jgi:fibronectin-binding autotransporter adhesin